MRALHEPLLRSLADAWLPDQAAQGRGGRAPAQVGRRGDRGRRRAQDGAHARACASTSTARAASSARTRARVGFIELRVYRVGGGPRAPTSALPIGASALPHGISGYGTCTWLCVGGGPRAPTSALPLGALPLPMGAFRVWYSAFGSVSAVDAACPPSALPMGAPALPLRALTAWCCISVQC